MTARRRAPRASKRPIAAPPTAKGRRTRQRLLDAAEAIFGELGYERASIVEITRHADVALGTFYVYFPNKQMIFAELVNELGHGLRRRLSEAIGELSDRIEIEEAGCRAFLEFVRAHKNLYRIVRQAEFVDEALYRSYYERLAASYVRGLERAMAAGEVKRLDPETVAYALMGIFDFLGMRWVLWKDRLPPRRVIDDVFSVIRCGLARESAAERPPATARRTTRVKQRGVKESANEASAKKASAKKASAKKASAKKASAKKASATKASAKKSTTKKSATRKSATKKSAAGRA